MIVKVKEPLLAECRTCAAGKSSSPTSTFAADEPLTRAVMASGVTAIAYETIRDGPRAASAAHAA